MTLVVLDRLVRAFTASRCLLLGGRDLCDAAQELLGSPARTANPATKARWGNREWLDLPALLARTALPASMESQATLGSQARTYFAVPMRISTICTQEQAFPLCRRHSRRARTARHTRNTWQPRAARASRQGPLLSRLPFQALRTRLHAQGVITGSLTFFLPCCRHSRSAGCARLTRAARISRITRQRRQGLAHSLAETEEL